MNINADSGDSGYLEGIGIFCIILVIVGMLCIPGAIVYQYNKVSLRAEIINELCNAGNGRYEFCELKETTFHYEEAAKKEKGTK